MPFVKLSNDLLCERKDIKEILKKLNDSQPVSEQIEILGEKIDRYILNYLLKLAKESNDKSDFIHKISVSYTHLTLPTIRLV